MAEDFRELKKRVKPEFHKNYSKYYPVESLKQMGFSRSVCTSCGRGFWSLSERDFCDEPACSGGYRFIGEKLTRKAFNYKQAWDEYVKTFEKWGYVPIKRYPVVCRWYDQLYFVGAGINDFQPYVVSGEVPPPADAVLEPQFCLRFPDIDSVGVTGRHYTGFIMVGQHTFNTPEKHVYFKDEGILQMHEFLTKSLGIPKEEIFYHEDVWAGGGNFGPSMEFFARGLELGNQVYMQYEVLPGGKQRELKTKVIDMGAGLERWSWFSQGAPMSYDTVFPKVMNFLYKQTGVKPDKKVWNKFARYAGLLTFDEIENASEVWVDVAKEIGIGVEELKKEVYRMRALYAIGDHTRTLLVGMHDGALPSNVGGGYNLRNILRRCWSLMDEFKFKFEIEKVFETHVKEFGSWYTELKETGSLWDVLAVEHKRFEEGKRKAKTIVKRMVSEKQKFSTEKLVGLYDSQGIHPSMIKQAKPDLKIVDNFYQLVSQRHEKTTKTEEKKKFKLPTGLSDTKTFYYDKMSETKFSSKVLAVVKDSIVLESTLFYPEGGGQLADMGTLNGVKIVDVQKEGGVVLHKVENPLKFKKGDKITGVVDANRRKQLTQHHTATHVINAAASRVLGSHVWQAGAHKSVSGARLDVTHYKAISESEVVEIESEANRIVKKGIAVKKLLLPREEAEKKYGFRIYQGGAVPGTELRIIDILGVDAEACGGTHLDNTKEIGGIKVVKATRIQDGVVRIEFKAGSAATKEASGEEKLFEDVVSSFSGIEVADDGFDSEKLNDAAKIFSVQKTQLPKTIERFMGEIKTAIKKSEETGFIDTRKITKSNDIVDASKKVFALWKSTKKISEKLDEQAGGRLEKELEMKFSSTKSVKHLTNNLDVSALTKAAMKAISAKNRVLVLVNIVGEKCNIVVASSNSKINAGELARDISQKLGGGGRGDVKLGVGGGKSKNAEKTLEKLKI